MITPQDQQKADTEAARLDNTHQIERVGYGPIPRPSRVDEGMRRAAAEPMIEPDTSPPFVRVESDSDDPFLMERLGDAVVRIYLNDGEFSADVKRRDRAATFPCASWESLVWCVMPFATEIARTREINRLTGLVLAKLDGGAA